MEQRGVIIEQVGDDFGVTVQYAVKGYSVDFTAFDVLGVADDGTQFYELKGATSSNDDTDNIADAQPLVTGSVKWDGCSHYYFGDAGYIHAHGRADIQKLTDALVVIYERCGSLMKAEGSNLLEGEFECA